MSPLCCEAPPPFFQLHRPPPMPIAQSVRESMQRSSWIRQMFEEGARLKALHGADQVHDFSIGNPVLEPPAAFHEALRGLLETPAPGLHRYMPNAGYPEVRAYEAAELKNATALEFVAEDIVMCCGAGGGLNVVLKAMLDPGDEVIALAPYFVEYGFYAQNHGGVLKPVSTNARFQPDLNALDAAIGPQTKVVLVNSPNNPTGVVYSQETLDALGALLQEKEREVGHPIYLVSDDIYRRLTYDGVTSGNALLSHPNSLLVTSHSKDLGLPGERIGYIAVNPQIEERTLVQGALVLANRVLGFVNAPGLMQRILPQIGDATVDIAAYERLRNRFLEVLEACHFDVVRPQGAFYFFPKAPEADDIAFVKRAQEQRLLLVPGTGFGAPGYFRISFCCTEAEIERAQPAFEQLARHYGLI